MDLLATAVPQQHFAREKIGAGDCDGEEERKKETWSVWVADVSGLQHIMNQAVKVGQQHRFDQENWGTSITGSNHIIYAGKKERNR
jgi:hypothetical protein